MLKTPMRNDPKHGTGLNMAKKNTFEKLIGGIISPGKKVPRDDAEDVDARDAARTVEDQAPRPKKERGLLDPLMEVLASDEKLVLISSLMDFVGDFLVKMLDQNNFELTKLENAISVFQSTVLNQVRLIRNQLDIARQQGLFKMQQPARSFIMPPGASIDSITAASGAADGLQKKRQPTERDIMDIAASIRTLVTRQKLAKDKDEGTPEEPAKEVPASTEVSFESTILETPVISPLDSKIEQFQKHGDEQKQRIEKMSVASRPVQVEKPSARVTGKKRSGPKKSTTKKSMQQKPGTKPAAKQASSKKAPKTPVKKRVTTPAPTTSSNEVTTSEKMNKERDLLPEGFQQELMKNIKDLIKDKEKRPKIA